MTPRVVPITGALTGIGRAAALAFAHEGATVVVSGRRDAAGHAPAAERRAPGGRAASLHADVRHAAAVRSLVGQNRFTGGSDDAKQGFLASLPARRAGTPDDIAQTIVFLASDKARFLTGQSLAVDGGFTAQQCCARFHEQPPTAPDPQGVPPCPSPFPPATTCRPPARRCSTT